MRNTVLKILFYITILFTCNSVHAQWSALSLLEGKLNMASASLETKVYFAGGADYSKVFDDIEIYDTISKTWSYQKLSAARSMITGVSCQNKIFFAGGFNPHSLTNFSVIDIFNSNTQEWIVKKLPQAGIYKAVKCGNNKVVFGCGLKIISLNPLKTQNISMLYIYDLDEDCWEHIPVKQSRKNMQMVATNENVYLAGGILSNGNITNKVDVYNIPNSSWKTIYLSVPRSYFSVASYDEKVFFAGGKTILGNFSDLVNIYDESTFSWSSTRMNTAKCPKSPGISVGNKIYFIGGSSLHLSKTELDKSFNNIDIFDINTKKWSNRKLPFPIIKHTVIATENILLLAGGIILKEDKKVLQDILYIYEQAEENSNSKTKQITFEINPRVRNKNLHFNIPEKYTSKPLKLNLIDLNGRIIFTGQLSLDHNMINATEVISGVYIILVTGENVNYSTKVLIR